MFNIYLHDSKKIPEDDICYIVAKNGIYLKKKMGVMESIAKVDKISMLEEITPTACLNIPLFPAKLFAKVIEFFRAVYKKHHAEAVVLLFYNQENGHFKVIPPKQKVNGGSCDFTRDIQVPGYILLGDIHSHGSMSAFHSGTDDKDEKGDNDGLHITVGNVSSDDVTISLSIIANGTRFIGEPEDYIDKLVKVESFKSPAERKVYKYINGKLQEVKSEPYVSKYHAPRYKVDIPESQKVFNKKWLKKVEYKVFKWSVNGQWKNVHNKVDKQGWAEYWQAFYAHIGNPDKHPNPSLFNQPAENQEVKSIGDVIDGFGDDDYDFDDDDDFNPCCECVFKETKIDWALEQYTEPDEDVDNPVDNFIPDDAIFMASGDESEGIGEQQHIESIVKEQLESPEFLHGQTFEGERREGEKIPKIDDIPINLRDKPIAWIRKYLKGY